jgi:hypothetical protein
MLSHPSSPLMLRCFTELLCGVMWCYVVLCGVMWCNVVLCGVMWCNVVLWAVSEGTSTPFNLVLTGTSHHITPHNTKKTLHNTIEPFICRHGHDDSRWNCHGPRLRHRACVRGWRRALGAAAESLGHGEPRVDRCNITYYNVTKRKIT